MNTFEAQITATISDKSKLSYEHKLSLTVIIMMMMMMIIDDTNYLSIKESSTVCLSIITVDRWIDG